MTSTFFNITGLLIFTCIPLFSQNAIDQGPFQTKIIPPSPEAASLGKYGEVPVGLYTGVPSVSIPLFTIEGKGMSLPTSISYHAGGNRVEEVSSRVGLGWSFNGGGVISRTIRGLPDDNYNGWLNSGFDVSTISTLSLNVQTEKLNLISNGDLDAEPDLFYYNFNGQSGQFFMSQSGEVTVTPHSKIIFEPTFGLGTQITGWKITDESGATYYFGKSKDHTRSEVEISETMSGCNESIPNPTWGISSWLITEMYDYNEDEKISFFYKDYTITNCNPTTQTLYFKLPASYSFCGSKSPTECYTIQTISGKRLDFIESAKQKMMFIYGEGRLDLPGDSTLSQINLYNVSINTTSHNEPILSYDFYQSYFSAGGVYNNSIQFCNQSLDRLKRLRLDSLVLVGNQSDKSGSHKFKYHAQSLPDRLSFAQDFWGFYNGETLNSTSVPEYEYHDTEEDIHFLVPGANKFPNLDYAKACILTEIQYPTGGRTVFEHESNSVFSDEMPYPYELKSSASVIGNGSSSFYSTTFTISNLTKTGSFVKFPITSVGCDLTTLTCGITFNIEGVTDPSYSLNLNNITGNVFLKNGTYNIEVTLLEENDDNRYFTIMAQWKQELISNDNSKIAGGLRIKSIKNFMGLDLVNHRKFVYTNSEGVTSGRINSYFIYEVFLQETKIQDLNGSSGYVIYDCYYLSRSNFSKTPLGSTHGSNAGYGEVSEFAVDGSHQLKTTSWFTNNLDHPDSIELAFPFPPVVSKDYLRGKLKKQITYELNSGIHRPLKKIETIYEIQNQNPLVHGITTGLDYILTFQSLQYPKYKLYANKSGFSRPSSQYETLYAYADDGIDSIKSQTYFYYENPQHLQLTKVKKITKDTLVTRYKYPLDVFGSNPISALISKKVKTLKIEQIDERNGMPISIHKWNYALIGQDVRLDDIQSSVISNLGGDIALRNEIDFRLYAENGNVLEYQEKSGAITSVFWGYSQTLPIALVVNAEFNKIYFNSFEEADGLLESSENPAKCGNKYFNSGSFNFSTDGGFIPDSYLGLKMSYWYWQNDRWNFIEENFNNIINNGTRLDEIRVFPVNSQMTTYTYDVNGKIKSITDPNNESTYFVYDGLSRLALVKDSKGNVIKKVKYHYANN